MKTLGNKILAVGLVSVMLTLMPACNSSQALTDVRRFEPVVVNALVLACAISPSAPMCGTMQVTIKADFDLVVKLWGDWNAAVKAGTSTSAMWNDLNAAFTTFEQDSAAIFSLGLGLNQPEVTAIVAAAQVLLAAIEALFPSSPADSAVKPTLFSAYTHGRVSYDKAWLAGWAKDYNAKLDVAKKAHPGVKLHKAHA